MFQQNWFARSIEAQCITVYMYNNDFFLIFMSIANILNNNVLFFLISMCLFQKTVKTEKSSCSDADPLNLLEDDMDSKLSPHISMFVQKNYF